MYEQPPSLFQCCTQVSFRTAVSVFLDHKTKKACFTATLNFFLFLKRHALQLTNSQQRNGGYLSPFSPKMAALIVNLKVHLRLYFPLDK